MKLLFESGNFSEINKWKSSFEAVGVPVFVSGTESFKLHRKIVGYKLGFWILIDAQYEEAKMFYKNEIDSISNPIDVSAFHELQFAYFKTQNYISLGK